MDLNDIKPPGLEGTVTGPVDETPLRPEREESSAQLLSIQSQSAAGQTPLALRAFAHLDKTVFQDPAKLDLAVRDSISELIDSRQDITGPLMNSQKELLTDFLARDPLVQRQVEGLLRKVLT